MDPAAPGPSQARPPAVCPPSVVRHLSAVPVPVVPVRPSSTVLSTGAAAHHEAASDMPSTDVGKIVYLVCHLEGGTINEAVLKLAERWLSPFLEIGSITQLPSGFVAMGRVCDQARLNRNIKVAQVRLSGVTYAVEQLTNAGIKEFNTLIAPEDRLNSEFESTDSDYTMADDLATSSDESTVSSKRPKSPSQKAKKKAYKKRRQASKRKLSGSGSSGEPTPAPAPVPSSPSPPAAPAVTAAANATASATKDVAAEYLQKIYANIGISVSS